MASRFWVGGTGTWDTSTTTHWSASTGGASGASAPTAADDVFIDANSGGGTITFSSALCRSLDCTGAPATTLGGASTITVGDASGGPFKLVANISVTGTWTLSMASSSNNGGSNWGITTAGKTLTTVTLGNFGGYKLLDALTVSGSMTLNSGTFDTNNQTIATGNFSSSNASTRTLTLGSSSWTVTGTATVWDFTNNTNLTFNSNTSTITFSGSGALVQSGARTFNNIVFSGSGTAQWNGAGGTIANLTRTGTATKTDQLQTNDVTVSTSLTLNGNSTTNRILYASSTIGTARAITLGASATAKTNCSNVDFKDITMSGGAANERDFSAITGNSGDCGGNTGITFTTPATQTHTSSAGGNWSDNTKWTSRVPLPQDNVIVDVNTTGTLTADMPRLGKDLTFTGFAGTASFNSVAVELYGSFTLAAGMAFPASQTTTFAGRGSHTITSAGHNFGSSVLFRGPGGSYTFLDAFSVSSANFSHDDGTINSNNQSVTIGGVYNQAATRTRALTMGTSTWTFTNTATSTPYQQNATGMTLSAASSTIVYSTASVNTRTFQGAGLTYGTLTYTVAGSTGQLTITGSNTFDTINFSDVTNARTLQFTAGTVNTIINSFNVNGTSGKLMTVNSSTGGTPALLAYAYKDGHSNVFSLFGSSITSTSDYLQLPGANGNYASAPDTAALSITGDIDLRMSLAVGDWTPDLVGGSGTDAALIGKYTTATNNRSYLFTLAAAAGGAGTSGRLRLYISSDGTAANIFSATSSSATGFVDGSQHWVRVTYRASDGQTIFYKSSDGAVWTQLGSTQTMSGGGHTIFDSTQPVEIGSFASGSGLTTVAMSVYQTQIRNNILDDGTGIVLDQRFAKVNTVQCDYLSLQDSTALGSASWYAGTHSTNVSGNTGWIFGLPNDATYKLLPTMN